MRRINLAWTSTIVTQNGNTTVTWSISGGSVSSHDCIVVQPISGSSGLRLTSKTVFRSPTRYHVTVQVVGSGAMAYRFKAEAMN
jgi:hypothetical protein